MMVQLELDFCDNTPRGISCPVCKKIFEKSKIRSNHTYCSRLCKSKKYKIQPKEKSKKAILICFACKKSFERKSSKQRFCSKECYAPFGRELQRSSARKYHFKNREKILKKQKQYRIKNIEKIKERIKKYEIENKEKLKLDRKLYNIKNREKRLLIYKRYRDKTKEERRLYRLKTKERSRQRAKERMQNDLNFKLSYYLRARVRAVLKSQKATKAKKTLSLLGCSWEEAKNHIQSKFKEGMTWENYGYYGWHIDHIIPCSFFDLTDPEQQKKCFHYTNLQPLWGLENISKGNKLPDELQKNQ